MFRKSACILLSALGVLLHAGVATAGSYEVVTCDHAAAYGYTKTNNAWTYSTTDDVRVQKIDSCPSGGFMNLYTGDGDYESESGLGVDDVVGMTSSNPSGGWTFTAPSGTTITNIVLDGIIGKVMENAWQPTEIADGVPTPSCDGGAGGTCFGGLLDGDYADSTLTVGFFCADAICSQGQTEHAVWTMMYGATITLSENSAPTVTVSGGALTSESAYHNGTESITYSASDPRGIKSAKLLIDGATKSSTDFTCDYTYVTPCSDQSDQTLSADTAPLSDGSHIAKVVVKDAANNEAESSSWTIEVDKTAPGFPQSLASQTTSQPNNFTVSWSNPIGQLAAIVKAHYKICSTQGTECSENKSQSGTDINSLTNLSVPTHGDYQLRVWLEDEAGNADPSNYAATKLSYPAEQTASTPSSPSSTTTTATTSPKTITSPPTIAPTTLKLKPKLKLAKANYRKSGLLKVSGTCSSSIEGKKITLTFKPKKGKSSLKKKALCKTRKFKTTLKLKTKTPGTLTATFVGTDLVESQLIKRRV